MKYPTAEIYRSMGNKERAVCTFEAITRMDAAEIERIRASVPRVVYSCPETEFTAWRDGIIVMAQLWHGMYWRETARMLAARLLRLHKEAGAELPDGIGNPGDAEEKAAAKMRALQLALEDVCTTQGLPLETMRRFMEVPSEATAEPDEAYRQKVRGDLLGCLPGGIAALEFPDEGGTP